VFIKAIAKSGSLVIRYCTNERINAPSIQISDKSRIMLASTLLSTTNLIGPALIITHINRRSASSSLFSFELRFEFDEFPAVSFDPSHRKR